MHLPNWLLRVAGWVTPQRRRRTSLLMSVERFEPKALLSAFVVDSPLDQPDANVGDGLAETASGETTLRAAVQEANATPGPDTIVLPPGFFDLLLPGSADHSAASGDLEITDDLTIIGAGQEATFIDASQIDSAFHIQTGVALTFDDLTLQVPSDSETGIVNDGGTLTLDDASIDEVPALSIPAVDRSVVTTNARHADLLVGLYQPVVNRDEPLDAIFAPPPIFVTVVNNTKPDATIAIGTERGVGTERSRGWSTTEVDPELKPTPERDPSKRSTTPVRIADQSPEVPGDSTKQRRRAVVNSLFQDGQDSGKKTVKPVAGEKSEAAEARDRRQRENFPMLLPMDDDGILQVVPDDSAVDRPVPPPLPEPALLKEAAGNAERAAGQSAPAQALMAGVLLTMVRPGALRRAVQRIAGWKNLVV